MILNQSYVLKGVVGDDMFNEIKSFMVNPLKESRESLDNELYKFIWKNIYEEFKKDSLKRMNRLRNSVARCMDLDTVMDINETIADIQYNIDTIDEKELMEYTPKINKEELLYKIEKRVEKIYWREYRCSFRGHHRVVGHSHRHRDPLRGDCRLPASA